MPISVDLRAEAEVEAVRIRSIRAKTPADSAMLPTDGVAVAVLRRPGTARQIRPGAIFFTRTRIVDGSGRLVENLLVPVEVRFVLPAALRKRRDIGLRAQNVFDEYHAAVRSIALAEVARRITALAKDYGRGLSRARARESRLAARAETQPPERIQAGLFDRRALDDRDQTVQIQAAMSNQHRDRTQALEASSSLLVAQHSQIVLLLIVARGA